MQARTAPRASMAQRRDSTSLVLAGLAAIALFAFTRNGGGNGGGEVGPANVSGGLGLVAVEQGRRAQMAADRLGKAPGELITVRIDWTPGTTDADGNPETWPYRLLFLLGHNTATGWRTPGALGFREDGVFQHGMQGRGPGAVSFARNAFSTPDDLGVGYDVKAWLFGAQSDQQGNPVHGNTVPINVGVGRIGQDDGPEGVKDVGDQQGGWTLLAVREHTMAIIPAQPDESARVSGSLGLIAVSQGGGVRRLSAANARPRGGLASPEVPNDPRDQARGPSMVVGQSRPAGTGFSMPEVRAAPQRLPTPGRDPRT